MSEQASQGFFEVPGDIIIYVWSGIKHGSRIWNRYDLFSGQPSGGEETTAIGHIESERALTVEELAKRAKAVYERWARK